MRHGGAQRILKKVFLTLNLVRKRHKGLFIISCKNGAAKSL